jgi:hypothetical protein
MGRHANVDRGAELQRRISAWPDRVGKGLVLEVDKIRLDKLCMVQYSVVVKNYAQHQPPKHSLGSFHSEVGARHAVPADPRQLTQNEHLQNRIKTNDLISFRMNTYENP